MTEELCTTHIICGNLVLSQRLFDLILTDMVTRQARAAYWLITTNVIHTYPEVKSWKFLVIRSLFTFELHVIEIFLPKSVLMRYIRRWPSLRHVTSGWHIRWLRRKLRGWHSFDKMFPPLQWPGIYVPLTLYVYILFWANALWNSYTLTWCLVSLVRYIGGILPNWYTYPEVKSWLVWLYQVSPRSSYTWLRCSSKTPFWCYMYISVGGHPCVRSVHGGIHVLAD